MKQPLLFTIIIFCIILFFIFISYFLTNLISDGLKTSTTNTFVQDSGIIEIFFCPQDNCEEHLLIFLSSAKKSIHCALYDLGLNSVKELLIKKEKTLDVRIVIDDEYYKKFPEAFVRKDGKNLMHDKFCIVDNKEVLTGSMNPTENDAHKNNNNLLIINSPILAANYEAEFQELWRGEFKKGKAVRNPKINLNGIVIKNYFCPEDACADRIKEELKKAEKSIYFLTFSFTHDGIANILLLKKRDGLQVRGVMESRQITMDAEFKRLQNNGIDILKDGNKNTMHHKVFIIDGQTVITGSMNPTRNGDEHNDENVLIIYDQNIAEKFVKEFEKVFGEAKIQ
ncbi:DUF1669 domain-containing protein [Candidatus Woesearchaeota archaeon]|nr:DUF1669 domain-containing protein [Candidatus Woesearchaeota archaeon]